MPAIIRLSVVVVVIISLFSSCRTEPDPWVYDHTIALKDITPVCVIPEGDHFWIADADNNRLVKTDAAGKLLDTVSGLSRPMHMALRNGTLYIPEYGNDTISLLWREVKDVVWLPETPSGPSGVDKDKNRMVVADFYNHRVIYVEGEHNLTFGHKGKEAGAFGYPTDVQFAHDKIFVADAHNHRIQVFDLKGQHLKTIGEKEGMKVANGIFVSQEAIFVTDNDNSRLLVYDLEGVLVQIITEGLNKPADAWADNKNLYVANQQGRSVSVYRR
ncbi:MAG: hypothetical protein HUU01_00335 [Saprospiraceae bacterium]|nr:hypothetical protein [Saprospiraceae bacterium]